MFDQGVISFAHGEGMRRPHPTVVAAGVRSLLLTGDGSLEEYGSVPRLQPLDRAITAQFVGMGIPLDTASQTCLDAGTTRLFLSFLHVVTRPGDVILSPLGYYHSLAAWCDLYGLELECVPTRREYQYKLLAEDLASWLRKRPSKRAPCALILFNPSYSGAVYHHHELAALAQVVEAHRLLVLEDAIFGDVRFDLAQPTTCLAACPGMADRVVTVTGPSKARGLANVRIGWACGPQSLIRRMNSLTAVSAPALSHVSKAMAAASLEAPATYLEENVAECRRRATMVIDLAAQLNAELSGEQRLVGDVVTIECLPEAGHSILVSFPGVRGAHTPRGGLLSDSVDLARYLLQDAGVAISPGLSMGFDGFETRLAYGCVGFAATYEAARAGEMLAFLEVAAEYLPRQLSAGLKAWRKALRRGTEEPSAESVFAVGRSLIQDAIGRRLRGALSRLRFRPATERPRR